MKFWNFSHYQKEVFHSLKQSMFLISAKIMKINIAKRNEDKNV